MVPARITLGIAVGALVLAAALASGCSGDDAGPAATSEDTGRAADGPTGPDRSGAGPVPGETWDVDDPSTHGIDPTSLDEARTYAFAEGRNTQGVVVVYEGVIVAEWYAPGADETSWAASWSMAKSMTSALVGIAIGDGLISSVDEPMTTYFPDWQDTPRETITLRDVLQMETGRDWDEDYDPASFETSDIIQMGLAEPDQLRFASEQPLAEPPNEFLYSSGDTMLLSGVIEQATGMPAHEYAQTELFDPLGIDQVEWWRDAEGHTLTYCCVDTTSRDFARFGLLYLRGGAWGGDQVVPAEWVEASISDTADTYEGYGYQWWLSMEPGGEIEPYYTAEGVDGQYIYVFPGLDLLVVRNGVYDKTECEPVADPNLFGCYPSDGLVPGQGTIGPDEWSDEEFLTPILQSLPADG